MTDQIHSKRGLARVVATVTATVALLATLQVGATAADLPAAAKELIPAAKKEGTLNLAWGASTLGGSKGVKRYQEGFNKHYGLNHKFKFTVGTHFHGQTRKLIQELNAGQKAFMDITLAGGPQFNTWTKYKGLVAVNWGSLMPHIAPATLKQIVAADNTIVEFIGRPRVIVYNTNLIKAAEAPKSMGDLLNPKWKGKIASTPYAAGFVVVWPKSKLIEYARKLTGNLGGLMRCGEYDRITSGEFPIFAIACEPGRIQQDINRGSPMAMVIPHDFMGLDHWYFGVPKHSRNPATAKLFIAWMMTKSGQDALYKSQGSDMYLLPGSRTAKVLDRIRKQTGKEFVSADVTNALTLDWKTSRAVAKIFRESRRK